MKTLLVLAKQPELAAAMSAALDQDQYRVLLREQPRDAESLLRQGLIDACVIEADLTNVQPIRTLEQLHRLVPRCPILVYASGRQWEWEEDAYLLGAAYILSKPVRAQLLNALLDRLWAPGEPAMAIKPAPLTPAEPVRPAGFQDAWQTLAVLRNFSSILSNSLCSEALLKQFLLFLREILGVNRAAIFLRPPLCSLNLGRAASEDRRLRSACAIGLASGLLEHLTLSLEAGIGGYVYRQGRILRIGSEEANRDREIHKEFEILGVQVAIPILDRESLVGVAVLDGRLTGEPFANDELSLVFHLLEQLGLAIRNSWLHDELVTSHEMMTDILNQLGSSCLVINHNMDVIHGNRAARSMFGPNPDSVAPLEFCSLPIVLSGKVFEALKHGQGMPPFFYQPPDHRERMYRVTISPFYRRNFNTANAVLLVVEDYTQQQRSQELEIESANLRLGATMAEHLAHEIGNSLVPLSTHQQLLPQKIDNPEFRASLTKTMTESVNRIGRLAHQMLYLTRDTVAIHEIIPVPQLLEEAFAEAQLHHLSSPGRMLPTISQGTPSISGDHKALKHALAEILLNALQANPADPVACVKVSHDYDQQGRPWLHIEVEDAGSGFTEATTQKATQPFFSTRTVGLGLGLTVARKILQAHRGTLTITEAAKRGHGVVSLHLPLTSPSPNESPSQNP